MAFEAKSITLNILNILPVNILQKSIKKSRKYHQITASVGEIGIIEPLIVARNKSKDGTYLLLDGHLRLEVLKDLGIEQVDCLISSDDEGFTYNKRINRLATIQEHRMILEAVKRGVPEERIAQTLDVNLSNIRQKRRLLDGICTEVAELLKNKNCPMNTFQSLRKMKPMRQIEVVELMISVNNYSVSYSRALLAATTKEHLVDSKKPKSISGVSAEEIARMEKEMSGLQSEIKLVEDSYGPDHLNFILSRGYLESLLNSQKVLRYMGKNHQEILSEFQKISNVDEVDK